MSDLRGIPHASAPTSQSSEGDRSRALNGPRKQSLRGTTAKLSPQGERLIARPMRLGQEIREVLSDERIRYDRLHQLRS